MPRFDDAEPVVHGVQRLVIGHFTGQVDVGSRVHGALRVILTRAAKYGHAADLTRHIAIAAYRTVEILPCRGTKRTEVGLFWNTNPHTVLENAHIFKPKGLRKGSSYRPEKPEGL